MSRAKHPIRKGSRVWVRIPVRGSRKREEIKATVRRRYMRNGIAGPEPYVSVDTDEPISDGPLRFPIGDVRNLGLLDSIAEAAADSEDPNAQSTGEPGTGAAGPGVSETPPT